MKMFDKIRGNATAQSTEFCVDYKLAKYGENTGYAFTQSFFENITSDTFGNIKGLDETFQRSLWGDQTTTSPYLGLINYILKSFVTCQKIYLKVRYEKAVISQKAYIFYEPITKNEAQKTTADDVLVINFDNSNCGWCDSYLIYCSFNMLSKLLDYAMVGVELANQPFLKLADLRRESPTSAKDIQKMVASFSKVLREKKGMPVSDAGDSLELLSVNGDQYDKFISFVWGTIAQISRLPLSYISGNMNGTLNTTGEGDRMQIDRALKGYYNSYFCPIISRVYDIVGLQKEYFYAEDLASKIESLGTSLSIIESSMLLTQEKKEEMIRALLEI